MYINFLLDVCVYLNPSRSQKCIEFISELEIILFFMIDKIKEVNIQTIIVFSAIIVLSTLYFTRNN